MSEETLDQITWEEVYAQEEEKMIKALAEAEKEQEQKKQKSSEEEAVQEQQQVIREEASIVIYTIERPIADAYAVERDHEVGCGCCKEW